MEAWGRPRSEEFAGGPESFVLNGLNIYYNFLSLGYNISASAGSASSYSANPNGFNRVFASIDPPPAGPRGPAAPMLTWDKWAHAAYRSGRSFVTNGPLLHKCTINSQPPGTRFSGTGNVVLQISAYAVSASPLERVDLIVGGTVAHTWKPDDSASGCDSRQRGTAPNTFSISGDTTITVNASSWVAIRAFEAVPHAAPYLRYGHTSPWYVDIAGKPRRSAAAASFFVGWFDELLPLMASKKAAAPSSVGHFYDDAIQIYQRARDVYAEHYAASIKEGGPM
eukprot:m.229691 g.229691  ORF g.229691 m.229691 type:complete len:281 (+) comp39215_c0_seq1:3-845(+)